MRVVHKRLPVNVALTHVQIKREILNRTEIDNFIRLEKRGFGDFKLTGYINGEILKVYDTYTLINRNGYNECYPNDVILRRLLASV